MFSGGRCMWMAYVAFSFQSHDHEAGGGPSLLLAGGAVVSGAPGRHRGRRLAGARLLHAHLQLRRLADGHGQLRPADGQEPQPLRRAAVREDVLRPPHRPRQRRTPRHRLHRGGIRAVERDGDPDGHGARGLPARRQLRHHLGHRQQRHLLRGQRHEHQPLLAGHADALVPYPPPPARPGGVGVVVVGARRRRRRHEHELAAGRRAGGDGRDRRQRLQPGLLVRRAAGRGAQVRAGRGGEAGVRRRGAHRDGRARVRGAREPALRVHAALPAALRRRRRRRVLGLRRGHGVPRLVQPLRRVPQPGAHGAARQAPAPPPGRHHRLRRLVRRHDEHLPGPGGPRFHKRPAELLREPDSAVRQAWVPRLRRPVDVRVLGRHAPDGGRLQGDRRRGAARAVRIPRLSHGDLLKIESASARMLC